MDGTSQGRSNAPARGSTVADAGLDSIGTGQMTSRTKRIGTDDPRLEPYRNLKRTNLTRWSGRFVAEGRKVVERLFDSPFEAESVLVSEKRLDFLGRVPPDVPSYVLPQDECERLTGYEFHQGVLACGVRRPSPAIRNIVADGPATVAVAAKMTDPDNLGSLLRLAAAFGVSAVLLGPGSADPFSRRTLRVSMGAALSVPIVETEDLFAALNEMRALGFEIAGTVLDPDAEPLMTAGRTDRLALMFGNEAHGLSPAEVATCDRVVTVPMDSADSLNVSAAAAVFLYHFTRAAAVGGRTDA